MEEAGRRPLFKKSPTIACVLRKKNIPQIDKLFIWLCLTLVNEKKFQININWKDERKQIKTLENLAHTKTEKLENNKNEIIDKFDSITLVDEANHS